METRARAYARIYDTTFRNTRIPRALTAATNTQTHLLAKPLHRDVAARGHAKVTQHARTTRSKRHPQIGRQTGHNSTRPKGQNDTNHDANRLSSHNTMHATLWKHAHAHTPVYMTQLLATRAYHVL
jgi:hypothetical protein